MLKNLFGCFVVLAALACGAPAFAGDGPFGLEQGMTLTQLKAFGTVTPTKSVPDVYEIAVPKPHPGFESYAVMVSPQYGLCKVIATGVTVETNGHGFEIRSEFESVESALTQRYGSPSSRIDRVLPGSVWDDPQDFMMGVLKKDRKLWSVWAANKMSLPNGLEAISLEVAALSQTKAYLFLSYEFKCFSGVLRQRKAKEAGAL